MELPTLASDPTEQGLRILARLIALRLLGQAAEVAEPDNEDSAGWSQNDAETQIIKEA